MKDKNIWNSKYLREWTGDRGHVGEDPPASQHLRLHIGDGFGDDD